ncbi:hypothetical protein GCM10011571_00800 [Marinithermofilum abyssi]|uniref:Uncharacterized protein n=1 Tax=Marinithermofilum abyssi TaxID=1571185 RepID=A0A8J2VFM3_9BACL|nr:hypothetical protein [Marinithermofilum abyssi]GGE03736.1 hypothetical protein GCM10011571_00800 [Marinithermofilum abyssi]
MEYRDLMKWKGYISLHELMEPEENSLRVLIDRCVVGNESEAIEVGERVMMGFPIEVDEGLPIIQLDFESYVSYNVINESFTVLDEYEVFEGDVFRIYTKSRYLDFITLGTIAEDIYADQHFVHYQLVCLNHIIDIISYEEPKITELGRVSFSIKFE